tara:strand:- start:60 stop:401 length:342 start_codon:yes stop_codon:yes gene_type:complete
MEDFDTFLEGIFVASFVLFVLIIIIVVGSSSGSRRPYKSSRTRRTERYREYLKSEAWQRKRYVVFKRDNWTCQECGAKATEVHHLKYAKYQIGKEPIDWLVSLCSPCHRNKHN